MNYKYKRSQIFGKKLEVPKLILNEIYNKNLSFKDFIKYNLEDKIPTSCITKIDKQIVDRFGLEKAKQIDWELIDNINIALNVRDIVMSIEPQTEDINSKIYDLIKDKIKRNEFIFTDNEEKDVVIENSKPYNPDYIDQMTTDKMIEEVDVE